MKNGIVGFGLVGTGMAGGFHARELSFVDEAKLVAVCSRNEENVQRFAMSTAWNAGTRTIETFSTTTRSTSSAC